MAGFLNRDPEAGRWEAIDRHLQMRADIGIGRHVNKPIHRLIANLEIKRRNGVAFLSQTLRNAFEMRALEQDRQPVVERAFLIGVVELRRMNSNTARFQAAQAVFDEIENLNDVLLLSDNALLGPQVLEEFIKAAARHQNTDLFLPAVLGNAENDIREDVILKSYENNWYFVKMKRQM